MLIRTFLKPFPQKISFYTIVPCPFASSHTKLSVSNTPCILLFLPQNQEVAQHTPHHLTHRDEMQTQHLIEINTIFFKLSEQAPM